MTTTKPEGGRTFTFVDYDINRRGVTERARAHLMKDRVRSKRAARSEWVSRNQISPLRWMRPKEDNAQPDPAKSTASVSPSPPGESGKVAPNRVGISHFAAVIDFQNDSVMPSPPTIATRSESPRSAKRVKVATRPSIDVRDSSSEDSFSSSLRNHARSSQEGWTPGVSRSSDSASGDRESPESNAGTLGAEAERLSSKPRPGIKPRRTSLDSRSEFGFSLLENLKIESPSQSSEVTDDTPTGSVLSELEQSVERTALTPTDCNLIRYFANNAHTMLGLDTYPEVVQKYDPVLTLFVPFAISNHWCFETMVLLLGVYHYRKTSSPAANALFDAENQYIAARQNEILAQTRERISALANQKDSSDEDVVAFLFLALAEYCAGHRQIGLMHFRAWKEYCEMRRILCIPPCGLPCKTIVWWCVSVLVEDDVILDSIINPTTRAKVREDPEKLFRYFANFNGPPSPEGLASDKGQMNKLVRRNTS